MHVMKLCKTTLNQLESVIDMLFYMSRYFVHSVCTQVYTVSYSLLCTLGLIKSLISFYGFLIGLFDLNSNIGSMRV